MSRTTLRTPVLALLCLAAFAALPAPATFAAQAPGASNSPAASPADGPVSSDVMNQLLHSQEPLDVVTPPKYGPCTMSFQCSSICSGRFITCSGNDYCSMGYGPTAYSCHQNIYVQCDSQAPIYCVTALEL